MINPAEFKDGELDQHLTRLQEFDGNDALLQEQLEKYFSEFDSDSNAWLDRKELRLFLTSFFDTYHIHAPLTDEYVDATFREIDANRDNKIQPEELHAFASRFVKVLIQEFTKAKQQAGANLAAAEETKEETKEEVKE